MTQLSRLAMLRRALAVGTFSAFALVGGMALSGPVADASAGAAAPKHDAWLTRLDGKHRQLFDAPQPDGGAPLLRVMYFYDTFNSAFDVADRDIDAVLTFYGRTTFHGLSDAMWAKYELGAYLGEKGADGVGFTVNPWRTAPTIMGKPRPAAGVDALQKRGATFILCNNSLTILSGLVAQARGLDPDTVYEDMKANILPGVTLVPAMVIAIGQAQNAGVTYHRQ